MRPQTPWSPAGRLVAGMVVLLAAFGAAGCAAASSHPDTPFSPPTPAVHRIAAVPFVPGDPGACGPAALASLLAFRGDPVSAEQIAAALAIPSLAGVLPLDLVRFADSRRPAIVATTPVGSLALLRAELQRDNPVVVFLDLGIGPWRQGHFVVAIGYRDDPGEVLLYSGRDRDATMPYERFARAWRRTGWWTLLIGAGERQAERGT